MSQITKLSFKLKFVSLNANEKLQRYHLTPVRMVILKKSKNNMLKSMWRKGNPPTWLVGMQVHITTMENSMEVTQKTKNRVAL